MIVSVKDAFNKVIGCGLPLWQELEDVVLNVETTLNDWPLLSRSKLQERGDQTRFSLLMVLHLLVQLGG